MFAAVRQTTDHSGVLLKKLIVTVLILLCGVGAHAQEPDTVKFTTRSNNGPTKNRETIGVTWSIIGGALQVTAVTDSSVAGDPVYMKLLIAGFETRGKGTFPLGPTTVWRYGRNPGQIVTGISGTITINELDSITDRLTATSALSHRARTFSSHKSARNTWPARFASSANSLRIVR